MLKMLIAVMLSFLVTAVACSTESVKRTAYETLQNVREQDCQKHPSVECEKRERFETYEQQRIPKDSAE